MSASLDRARTAGGDAPAVATALAVIAIAESLERLEVRLEPLLVALEEVVAEDKADREGRTP